MPWGLSSKLKDMHPTKSNDGPILWMRPGEQVYSLTPFFFISPYEFKFRCLKSDLLSSPSRWGWHHTCKLAFENHEFEVEFLVQCNVENLIFVGKSYSKVLINLSPDFCLGWKRLLRCEKQQTDLISHLTSDVLFQKKISTINQGVHQKLEPPELRLVKTRKKSHEPFRRYRRLDFTTVFTK